VRRTLIELNGKLEFGEPKTAKGKRLVELPTVAVESLLKHKAAMLAEGHAGAEYVFLGSDGGFLRRQNVQRRSFKPLLKRAGLPNIRFHDLRHTSATVLMLQGVHAKVVQERLGHSHIGVTLETYSHVLPSMQKDAAGKLDALFRKTGT